MYPFNFSGTQSQHFYGAATAVYLFCTFAGYSHPAQAFTIQDQSSSSESTTSHATSSTDTFTVSNVVPETKRVETASRGNDYTQLTQTLDNFNFFSDGIASSIDEYIGFTGFVISDDNVSSSVVESMNSFLGAESNQSLDSGFTSLKDGMSKTQASANRANAAQQSDSSSSREPIVGPSYEQLKQMKGVDEPPPLLLVLGTSLTSIFLVSRVVR